MELINTTAKALGLPGVICFGTGGMMDKHDIVYILRNDIDSDEIRYSLRSVEKYFPHGKVWFYGGKPAGIEPDEYVKVIQQGASRYAKVTNTIRQICMNDDITEDFWLFNDDFFVMQQITDLKPMISGTISERVQRIVDKFGFKSKYAKMLEHTGDVLHAKGYDTLDYALHVPMLINRRKALEALQTFPGEPMFRCIYGNYAGAEAEIMSDVKVFENEEPLKDTPFMSTDNKAWGAKAGEYLRGRYPDPSRWETGHE